VISETDILSTVKKIHFIGIGGSGMSGLAEILHHEGYALTGSDNNESDTLTRIKLLGIPVQMGHKSENIGDAQLVVHTAAVHEDNPEIKAAKKNNIPVIDRGKLLGLISKRFPQTIAVSGTHGKTTTTCMITQVMLTSGLDPTAVIGGKLPLIGGNSRVGHSELMVCEACEFVDSFLSLHPAISVILNIDDDHLDYFKTMENLIEHFRLFTDQTSKTIIFNGDDENTLKAVKNCRLRKIAFGFGENNDYKAIDIRMDASRHLCFTICHGSDMVADIALKIPGKHNILNALAACAASAEAGASWSAIEKGLSAFSGAGRRFEILGKVNGITIADDYAHHPTEIKATLEAATQMDFHRVWAVFQPFTYSRTVMLMKDFANALQIADRVVLAEIMGSREVNTYNVYSKDLAAQIPGSAWFKTFDEIAAYVMENAESGDLVITLGCGDIYKAAKLMLKRQ
jgi:UDP-N-acetylmuramate--alanine ligase